jgi:hypothetical protein
MYPANDRRYVPQQLVRKNWRVNVRQRVSRGHHARNTVSVHAGNNTVSKQAVIPLEKNNVTWY